MVPDSDVELGLRVAREIANDEKSPANARIQAVRTILELRGKLGKHATPDVEIDTSKPLATMSKADLMKELEALRANPFGADS